MKNLILSALLLGALCACGDKSAPPAAASEPVAAPPVASNAPDVGRVEQIPVTAKGVGMTPGAAVNDALKTAIMQVNGAAVDAYSANLNFAAQATAQIDVYSDQGHDSAKAAAQLQGQAFAEQIITQSQGMVSSFKVIKLAAPDKQGGSYTVDIEASVAKFKAPADAGRIRIVVAPLRTKAASFNIGGQTMSASQVLEPLHRRIVDALVQTGRFTVLDRQFESELENELAMIGSGQTVNTDMAKLGQALSADLIWVGEVERLAYNRSARKLQSSDRELVSYSGGWQVSQRLINLATRQVQQSSTLQGTAPSIAPTTMGSGIDAGKTLADMQTDIVKQTTEAILLRSFPISIIERQGNQVVLSQGGSVLKEKNRYRVYMLGKELKDPQTGQSLGKMEYPCCEVVVDRVTPNVSYARLENVQIRLDDIEPSALQIREALATSVMQAANEVEAAIAPGASVRARPARSETTSPEAAAPKPREKDDW